MGAFAACEPGGASRTDVGTAAHTLPRLPVSPSTPGAAVATVSSGALSPVAAAACVRFAVSLGTAAGEVSEKSGGRAGRDGRVVKDRPRLRVPVLCLMCALPVVEPQAAPRGTAAAAVAAAAALALADAVLALLVGEPSAGAAAVETVLEAVGLAGATEPMSVPPPHHSSGLPALSGRPPSLPCADPGRGAAAGGATMTGGRPQTDSLPASSPALPMVCALRLGLPRRAATALQETDEEAEAESVSPDVASLRAGPWPVCADCWGAAGFGDAAEVWLAMTRPTHVVVVEVDAEAAALWCPEPLACADGVAAEWLVPMLGHSSASSTESATDDALCVRATAAAMEVPAAARGDIMRARDGLSTGDAAQAPSVERVGACAAPARLDDGRACRGQPQVPALTVLDWLPRRRVRRECGAPL